MMKNLFKALLFSFVLIGSTLAQANNLEEGKKLYNAGKYQQALSFFLKPDAASDPAIMHSIGIYITRVLVSKKTRKKPVNGIENQRKPVFLRLNSTLA